ncbi:protein mono-ADP-ribosyltransferase PARP15-like [Rana temporaria]|uniref:protein mono-ADP-ribosyltransferase PARP15-like n=1 Tax=Rana temporaria TaxID=8407 RepID=UPI001AAD0D99|nr:protein mono-ADP-ribosyltransferase PARP15-like [Rana temporaria]
MPVMQNNPYRFLSPQLPLPDPVNRRNRIDNPVSSGALPSQSLRNYGASGSSADTAFFGMVTDPSPGVYEMKIGSVTFQVKSGDITKEKTDVIVNSSNQDFTRCSGVSKAILNAAGPPIASSAAALGSQPHKGYVITGSGRLRQIIWILHVVGPVTPTSIKKTILDVLQECENLQVSSVTFPALGTGAGGLDASTVANSILDGLVDFIKSKSVRSLQTVKVVLLLHSMLNDFYMSMKTREGTPLPKAKSLSMRLSDGDSLKLPSHWKPMGETRVMEVDVPPGTPEYSAVQQKFQRSCINQIVKILRVQNRDLWLQYQIKKQNIDSQNGSTTNEKKLFHGTDFNSIQNVNHKGFNRSYAGKNAAVYGNGTYFAVNANYSAIETYSNPDGYKERHMYLARVLTGLYCNGRRGMITPPAKNAANSTDCYDSVTDNVQNPSMFVIFNDVQAYPEYHIVFQ